MCEHKVTRTPRTGDDNVLEFRTPSGDWVADPKLGLGVSEEDARAMVRNLNAGQGENREYIFDHTMVVE